MSAEIALEEEFAKAALNRATLTRLLRYLKPYAGRMVFALFLEVAWVVSMLVDPRLIRLALDGPLHAGDVPGMLVFAGWLVVNVAFRVVITIYELRITTRAGIDALHGLRTDVFDHIQRLSMRYFDRTKQGRIIARADRDVDTLEHLVEWGPVAFTSMTFSLALGFVQLWLGYGALVLWLVPAIPVLWAISRVFERLGFPAYRRVRETHAAISSDVAEVITGVRVVKACVAEDREAERLRGLQRSYRGAVMRASKIAGGFIPSLSLVFHAILVAILVVGGGAVVRGEIPLGGLVEFVLLIGFVLSPVEGLGGLYNECLVAGAAAERIFLLLDTTPEVKDAPGTVDPGRLRGEVVFDHVSFSYDPTGAHGRQLKDVCFRVEPGQTVALVGKTGAGKTSVVNLVARFYEPQEGRVLLDGRDSRTIPVASLHRQTGMVLQENFLFAGSVLENLRFVRPGLSETDARAGFAALGCTEVLDGLLDGLATDVGERGANLSEGERQIVCFVRALLADPAILILDEATSAVDTRTEAVILRALRALTSRQTTFVVAHRLSTIRHADRILVLDDGRVVESGTHDSLLAAGGTYAALYAEYAR
jgi:ABC-type multidrug transport system fused ATPase/permease subunit